MNEKEIVKMCDRLAYKYNNKGHREDMKMEGILKCYEILGEEPNVHPAKLYREAKRRMHDYINLDIKPVSIPKHSRSRRLVYNPEDNNSGDMSEDGYGWLRAVLTTYDVSYDEDYGMSDKDHVVEYERKEQADHIRSVASETLSATELYIIQLRYYQDLTQYEVGIMLGTNKMWVSRHEKAALKKLGKELL